MTEYWKQSESVEYRDLPVWVKNRMTEYEAQRFKAKADVLLETLDKPLRRDYNVERLVAYGHGERIGAHMSITHDPLSNGILVGNFEDFSVESVRPLNDFTVEIRFLYHGELDI